MSLTEHVSLTIQANSSGVSRAGFGTPLILSCNAAWAERVRTYTSISAVLADFPITTSPEYLAADAMFAQSPHPERIMIGRAAGKPTQRYTLSVAAVRNSYTYTIYVKGQGVTPTTVSYTSDGTATDAEIVGNLVSALNAVTGKNFTATGAASPFAITGDAAGNWFSVEVASIADLSIQQDHAEPATTLATDLSAINAENSGWYGLVTLYNSVAYVAAAAAWIESNGPKVYAADVNDSGAATVVEASGTDVLDDIDEANYTRTSGEYYRNPYGFLAARLLGRWLPTEPGSTTPAYLTLAGAVADGTLTDTHRSNISARQASYYKSEAGVDFFWDGKVGDAAVKYLDTRRDLDWLTDDMQKGVFGALVAANAAGNKLGFLDEDIATVEAEVRASLRRAEQRKIVAPGWTVSVPKAASISSTDRSDRVLKNVTFTATYVGAVHTVQILGTVSP